MPAHSLSREPAFGVPLVRSSDTTHEQYGTFQQHLVLLEDVGRVEAYLRAIGSLQAGGVVVDVGAGTGALSLMALRHGFDHAFLVEPSRKVGRYAQHLAELNGLADRITIVPATLESLSPGALPAAIDLVVTETISSLLFGFGSWDSMLDLVERLRTPENVVPLGGRLLAAPAVSELASRGRDSDGLAALRDAGIDIDLFERTFRSGGNVYDKAVVLRMLQSGALQPVEIARFSLGREREIALEGGHLVSSEQLTLTGLVTFWEVQLAAGPPPVSITNLDPRVTSWYPYYVPFRDVVTLEPGEELSVQMQLLPVDSPYNAFQFMSGGRELTNVLYW